LLTKSTEENTENEETNDNDNMDEDKVKMLAQAMMEVMKEMK